MKFYHKKQNGEIVKVYITSLNGGDHININTEDGKINDTLLHTEIQFGSNWVSIYGLKKEDKEGDTFYRSRRYNLFKNKRDIPNG